MSSSQSIQEIDSLTHARVSSTVTDATSTDATPFIPSTEDLPQNVEEDLLDIDVKKATIYRGLPEFKVYPLSSIPRGSVLIINNEDFVNDVFSRRTGSSVDVKNLSSLFQQLHFNISSHTNLGRTDMVKTIRNFSSLASHTSADMAVVCILSHGEAQGKIMAADGQALDMEWVLKQFNNSGCPGLHNKPKLFLLQACRGDEEDYGIPMSPNLLTVDTTDHARPMSRGRERKISYSMPTWEDMLIAYAAVPGYVANRNHSRGTWFIECFCEVLMEHSADLDLREMLDEVAKQLSNFETETGRKQSFSYEARHFYNKLYFNPGIQPPANPLSLEDHADNVDHPSEIMDEDTEETGKQEIIESEVDSKDERDRIRNEDRNERERIRKEEQDERELIRKGEGREREKIRIEERDERERIRKQENDEREKNRNEENEKLKTQQKEEKIISKEQVQENNLCLILSSMAIVIAVVSFVLSVKR